MSAPGMLLIPDEITGSSDPSPRDWSDLFWEPRVSDRLLDGMFQWDRFRIRTEELSIGID
jgi:hypothetical protein